MILFNYTIISIDTSDGKKNNFSIYYQFSVNPICQSTKIKQLISEANVSLLEG